MSAWEEYKKKHTLNSRTKTSPWEEYKNSRTVKSFLSVGSDAQSKSDPEDYETKKIELKAAADAEQAQVLSPDNLLLKSFVTHGSPSTITQGMQGIFQYIDWLKQSPEWLKYNQYTAAEQEEEKKAELAETAQWAKENPVIGSAASVGTSVLSGADYLSKAIETATVGQPVASSTPGLSEITHAIRGGVSEDMSDTGKFFYNTAMSGIDSLVAGLGGSGGAVLLGLGAASSTYNDIKERGGSEKQALVGGAVSGIFESLFEKVSIGNFSALKEMPVDSLKTLFKNYAKSAGVNFTEEALTEVANIAYDYFAMGDLSQYELMARSLEEQYLAQGMSASEAKKKAEQDTKMAFLKQVGEAGLSGALMSFGFTTVGAATSEYNAYKTGQGYADNSAQRDLVQLALQGDKNSQSYKMAENIAAKLDANKDATVGSREIGRLANMMGYEAAKAAEDAEKAERRERLKTTVMGLGFGAGSSNNKTYNINNTNSLINYAMSFPPETASYQMGEQLKGKKDITSAEEGTLIRTISQDIEQGNHKANPAAETISHGGNGNGQVNAEIAPVVAQAAKATVSREPVEVIRMANAQAAQQNEKTAAETQPDVSKSNTGKKAPGFYDNGRFTGTDEDAQYLDRMAKAAGISIEMVEAADGSNGWIVNGEAYLSENAEDPLRVVAKHEITHHLQDAAGEAYSEYRSYVEQIYRDRGTLDQQIEAIQQLYRKNGKELSREAALDELAADYAGELLVNESLIRKLAGENPSLGQRILNAIRELLQRFRTAFSSAEVKQLERAARLWEAALIDANAAYQRGEVAATTNTRYSMAGVNAKTADLDALSRAEEMERRGVDEETIFRDTGWIRGKDQKWRFEIDDSEIKYHRGGDAQFRRDHPEYAEHQELTNKMLFGTLTEAEHQRLLELEEVWGHERSRLADRIAGGNATLENLIDHPDLFAAYPELRNTAVRFENLYGGTKAYYRQSNNTIAVDESLRNAPEANLLHEIQHAIKKIEGFAGGASPEFWQQKIEDGFVRRGDRGDTMTAGDLYENTAGEIEARETAKRRNMTAAQRRESVPYRGDENTVFADGTVAYNAEIVPFRKQIDDVLNGKTDSGTSHLNMGTTPKVYGQLGFDTSLPVLITAKHVKNMNATVQTNDGHIHALSRGKIASLPRRIAEPVIVMRSKDYPDRIVVVTDLLNAKKEPVVVALQPDGTGNYMNAEIDANIALSGYGKKNFDNYLISAFSDGRMLLCNYEKSRQLQQTPGVQFPNNLPRGDFTDNIARFAELVKQNREKKHAERQSVKGSRDLQKQIDALERQNKRLKEQMKRTDVPKVRREVVKRSAKDLRSMYSSKIDVNVLTDRIEALYNKLSALSGAGNLQELKGVPSWAEVRAEARSIADAILAESRGNVNPMAEEYSEIRRELRGRKISISDEYRADLESAGGYEGIRKQNFGTFSLTKDGTPIDTVYEELNEKYPVLFPDDIVHPADQLVRLSDVMQELKAVEGNPFENDLDATAQYLAGEIEERFYDTPNQKPTLADKMANTYHQQRLRDQKQLRAKLADQRRAYEKQVDKIHTRYADENRKRLENQNAAQRRETIYRHANRLGKMLERPTDKRHVPEQLRGAALHMLRYINTESNYQLAKGADGKYHRTDPMEVLYQRMYGGEASDVKETGRTAAARALKAVYDDILKEGELSVDPDIGDYLEELAEMGNKPLGDMTRAELDTVWRVMQIVEHSITRANELHSEGRYRTIESMANALSEGVGNRKDRTNWAGPAGMVDQLLNRDMITPETFFHVLGDVGENIFRQMRNSADRQTAIVKEGSERAAKLIRESGVEFKKADKEHHTFHLNGGDLTLSTSQLMELYALSKRKQAMEHIYIGGLKSVGGVKGLRETGRSKPIKVTPADVSTMLETLTDKQKALMDGLQAYLSGDLAKHGNEESLKVYGYEKFKEKNYWPIKVSRTETKSDPTSEARSKTIPGYGMTKAVIPRASNSVELRSAIDTFAAHLNQMATYASWLGTNEDVTRLHNFKFTDDQNRADGTVKELFERVYGKKGSAYLDALLSDIAQGTKTGADKTVIEGMFSRWKAAKVGGNLRVIVQQPTAILRAMSVMNPKYLAVAKNPLAGWKKALKYSPIAQWKDWGYFEMDTGRSIRELITGTESNLDKAKNAFMWGAGAADSVAWGHLWNAVEAETADKHEELAKGSKEFYEAVAARFAEVVDRTQVVDSVLHRTQIMRSNSYAAKISTSFMSEPSKIYNMVVRDLYDLKNAGSDEKKTAAKKQLARTSSALIVSFAINAAAQALVDGLRDDDRDKKYGEKFAAALPGNFASNFNPVSYIPYFKDVWSLIEGYTLDRSDMEGISDLVNAVGQLGKAVTGESEKTVLNAGLNAACRLGDLLGIPVSNLKRDAAAIFDTVLSDAELYELQYEVDKLRYNQENASGVFYGDLYRSMNNDYDAYENIYEDMYEGMIERGVPEDDAEEDIASAMESRMKKELGVESVKSLPVRYSPPTSENPEDPFFALMKKAREKDTGWVEQLDPGSIEIAQAVDGVRDQKAIEKIKMIASQPYGDDLKKLAMRNVMSESLWGRYLKALNAGVTSEQYAEFLEAIAKEATKRTGNPDATAAQADVEAVLYRSKLSNAKKRAIWESYGWKAKSPW